MFICIFHLQYFQITMGILGSNPTVSQVASVLYCLKLSCTLTQFQGKGPEQGECQGPTGRSACGMGDIAVVVFGKYNLSQLSTMC